MVGHNGKSRQLHPEEKDKCKSLNSEAGTTFQRDKYCVMSVNTGYKNRHIFWSLESFRQTVSEDSKGSTVYQMDKLGLWGCIELFRWDV